MVKCDLCGGPLMIDIGGQYATCQNCGMRHSIERVKEMLNDSAVIPTIKPQLRDDSIKWEQVGSDFEERDPNALWRTENLLVTVDQMQKAVHGLFRTKTRTAYVCQINNGTLPYSGILTDVHTGQEYYICYHSEDDFPELEFSDEEYFGKTYPLPGSGTRWMGRPSFVHMVEDACEDAVIRYQVQASVFGADEFCYPVDYLIVKDGKPLLAICLVDKNNYRYKCVSKTKEAVERMGIEYMRFFVEMPNDPSYVTRRIKTALNMLY